jgi:hypothetical protein
MYYNEYVHTIRHRQVSRSTSGGTFWRVRPVSCRNICTCRRIQVWWCDAGPTYGDQCEYSNCRSADGLFSVDIMCSVNTSSRCAHLCEHFVKRYRNLTVTDGQSSRGTHDDHISEVISDGLDNQGSIPVWSRNIFLQRHIRIGSGVRLLSSSYRELFPLGQSGRNDRLTTHLQPVPTPSWHTHKFNFTLHR